MSDILVTVIAGMVMLVGLAGVVVPFVPGIPLVWAGALLFALQADEGPSAWWGMAIVSILALIGMTAKILLPQRRMAGEGTPRSTMFAGAIGAIIGFFAIPVVGMPVGAVVAILLAERRRTNEWPVAWASTKAAIVGFGVGTLVELGAALAMVAAWLVWVAVTS